MGKGRFLDLREKRGVKGKVGDLDCLKKLGRFELLAGLKGKQ